MFVSLLAMEACPLDSRRGVIEVFIKRLAMLPARTSQFASRDERVQSTTTVHLTILYKSYLPVVCHHF